MSKTPSKVIAGCFALAAFAVAVLAGLAGGNSAVSILTRALIAMIGCYPIGLMIGVICQRVMTDHIEAQRESATMSPESPTDTLAGSQVSVTTEAKSE